MIRWLLMLPCLHLLRDYAIHIKFIYNIKFKHVYCYLFISCHMVANELHFLQDILSTILKFLAGWRKRREWFVLTETLSTDCVWHMKNNSLCTCRYFKYQKQKCENTSKINFSRYFSQSNLPRTYSFQAGTQGSSSNTSLSCM